MARRRTGFSLAYFADVLVGVPLGRILRSSQVVIGVGSSGSLSLVILVWCIFYLVGCGGSSSHIKFIESSQDTPNPDRGFFDQMLVKDPMRFSIDGSKYRNHRILFLLDKYLNAPIPDYALYEIDMGLSNVARRGHRLIVRFMYDWPASDLVSSGIAGRRATSPDPDIILLHIEQLGPIISRYANVVALLESGMIGHWGEQHGDTDLKQSPSYLAAVVDAWRAAIGRWNIPVLIRYPKAYLGYAVGRGEMVRGGVPSVGLWNDCLGAYDDKLVEPTSPLRLHVVEGETCSLKPRVDYSCATMTRYFERIQLGMLHVNFYQPTIDGWAREGCLDEIKRRLGYRYVIRGASVNVDGTSLRIRIDNVGWGRSVISRPLYLNSAQRRLGRIGDLMDFAPGSSNLVDVTLVEDVDWSIPLELATDDGIAFSNTTGNLIYVPGQKVHE